MDCSKRLQKLTGLLLLTGLIMPLAARPVYAQTAFGFQDTPIGSNQFGSATNWTNGFSQAFLQLQPLSTSPNSNPTLQPMRRAFQLGAYVNNRSTGVEITGVMNGSVAQSMGLKQGDVIITVAGYQVGLVNDRLYDVADEIQKRMNSAGTVPLLVLDSRTRTLNNVILNANQANGGLISGNVRPTQVNMLPSGAVLRVELKNVSRPYQQIAGGTTIQTVTGYGPFRYELYFDPSYIDSRDRYQLVGSIANSYGQSVLEGIMDVPAPIPGQRLNYDLILQPAGVSQASNNSVSYPPDASTIIALFRQILQRDPDFRELPAWQSQLARGGTLDSMRAELLASRQFYDLSRADPALWASRMVEVTQNRTATSEEINRIVSRLSAYQGARLLVVNEYLASVSR